MALIDCARWRPQGGMFVFAYRYPQTNLSTYTQLVVYESQEALLFTKGQLMGKFGPGKHTLTTENLPLLRSLYGIPFGGKNPFSAEVWIVNKLYPQNLLWSVNNVVVHDSDYQTMLPLKVMGQYGVYVKESEKFLIKMVGTKDQFDANDMLSHAYGELASKIKSAVIKFMNMNNVGFKSISAHLDDLSGFLKENVKQFWSDYGLEMTKFFVTDIVIDTATPEGRRVSDAIASQASMSITGHSWQQEQMFGMANNAVNKMSGAMSGGNGSGGLLAGMMALNMMNGMSANVGGGMMAPQYSQPTFGGGNKAAGGTPQGGNAGAPAPGARMIYCASCSKKHSTSERFCPHCGSEYHPCPRCGSDNSPKATRCVSCGTILNGTGGNASVCSSCGASLMPGAAFCPSCGAKQVKTNENTCPRCGAEVPSTSRFCPACGQKVR